MDDALRQRQSLDGAAPTERQDRPEAVVPEWVRKGLHDLCQPLTAMECRLYLTQMESGLEAEGGPDTEAREVELRAAIRDAMAECRRMMHLLREMQERLHEAEAAGGMHVDGS